MSLPVTTSLSVLCVEMFPLNNLWRLAQREEGNFGVANDRFNPSNHEEAINMNDFQEGTNPLIDCLAVTEFIGLHH